MGETILVTGTGGGAGQSILKCLQGSSYRVIAADGDPYGAGLYTTGAGYVIPYAKSPGYVSSLLDLCAAEKVTLVLPGLDAELPVLSAHRSMFAERGVQVVVSSESVVDICDDKQLTANFLQGRGYPFPKTCLLDEVQELSWPLMIKPKKGGARSQGVRVVRTAANLQAARNELSGTDYVAQELIEGDEYTCGTVNLDGKCHGVIAARRILRDGDTYKAFIERQPSIEKLVEDAANDLGPFGACNFQLRLRAGTPYIFEINARHSGTTYCRALAGFNEPVMIADRLLRGVYPSFAIRPLTVLRYWRELPLENEQVATSVQRGIVLAKSGDL